jgi:hypothetical protein
VAARVFMSYSHVDEAHRDQLEVHLAMLKRQGLVEVWHDRRIVAGDDLDGSISDELERADIILLLVSPDFLASDYCYGVEMARAQERHGDGTARSISVILRPCDWKHTELARQLVTPREGLPITKWPDRDDAFQSVVESIRAAIESLGRTRTPEQAPARAASAAPPQAPRSGNLRLKKEFTQADADAFLLDAFEFIDRFFQGSLAELETRNPQVETRHRKIDANSFVATIYRNGDLAAACTIRLGGLTGNGITLSQGASASPNSFNESLSVEHDDQKLFLRPLGLARPGSRDTERALSHEGAAEYYWSLLLDPLQGD